MIRIQPTVWNGKGIYTDRSQLIFSRSATVWRQDEEIPIIRALQNMHPSSEMINVHPTLHAELITVLILLHLTKHSGNFTASQARHIYICSQYSEFYK